MAAQTTLLLLVPTCALMPVLVAADNGALRGARELAVSAVLGPGDVPWGVQEDTYCTHYGPVWLRMQDAMRACLALGPACSGISDRGCRFNNSFDFRICRSTTSFQHSQVGTCVYQTPAGPANAPPAGAEGTYTHVCDHCRCFTNSEQYGSTDEGAVASLEECEARCTLTLGCDYANFYAEATGSRPAGQCYTCRRERWAQYGSLGGVMSARVDYSTPYPTPAPLPRSSGACASGEGQSVPNHEAVVACPSQIQGHHIASAPGCARGWRVCDGIEVWGVQKMQYSDASSIQGCFAFNANQDWDQCLAQCGSSSQYDNQKGANDPRAGGGEQPDLAGMGSGCERLWSSDKEGCTVGGRIDTGNQGCLVTKSYLAGVMCCIDRDW